MGKLRVYKYYFLPAIIFLVIFFTTLVFLWPNIINLIQIQKRIAGERSRLAQLTGKLSQLQALDENNLVSKTEVLLKIVPSDRDAQAVLASLKNLSLASDIDLKSVQLDPGDSTTDFPMLANLKLEGEVESLKKFLEKVDSVSPLMRLKAITATYLEGSLDEISLVIETFSLQFPQTLGAVDSPLPEISPQEERAYEMASSFELFSSEGDSLSTQPSGKENPFSF